MPRGLTNGSIIRIDDRHLIVRKRYTDRMGRRREKKRHASSVKEAYVLMREVEEEIDRELAGLEAGPKPARVRTFADLVDFYRKDELKPAEYVGETKVAGLRSFAKFESRLKPLERFFGSIKLRSITYADCEEYKRRRLQAPTARGQRSIAAVNRELSLLRHVLFIAVREQWITEHPFQRGKPLIQTADEVSRMRILTWEEEAQLLATCTGPRAHLRLALIFAIETALRQGEQFTLQLRDVDMDDRVITLRAYNSKSAQTRVVPIFERLHRELSPRIQTAELLQSRTAKIFTWRDPKKAFATACRLAGIEGLRWHDLRHTAITRLLHFYGVAAPEVMKISGHTNYKTFLRYVNIDREVARSIASKVDALRAQTEAVAAAAVDDVPVVLTTNSIN